jgi:tetratricopeptide (TPR) repeat protein
MLSRLLLFCLLSTTLGCQAHLRGRQGQTAVAGPESATLPFFRDPRVNDKVFLSVRLEDGKDYLFLVDTGSSVTVISREVSDTLDIKTELRSGRLVGLSGSVPWRAGVLESVGIGPFTLHNVEVAVDVPGMPTRVGLVPLAGILGNNALAQFQLAIDYPGNTIDLALGAMVLPNSATAMFFDGQHPLVRGTIQANRGETIVRQPVVLEIDTGSRGLMVSGRSQAGLEAVAEEGDEPILGIGAADGTPTRNLIQSTRRISVQETSFGGAVISRPITATWLNFNTKKSSAKNVGMPGLVGYEVFKTHKLMLDYIGRKMALVPSGTPQAATDVHRWYLRQLQRRRKPQDRLTTVKVELWLGEMANAKKHLARLVRGPHPLPAAVVLQARIDRDSGSLEKARALLESLTVRQLAEEGELLAWVNTLWLSGEIAHAVEVAQTATVLVPDDTASWVAFADALRAAGRPVEARSALSEATQIMGNPDAFLLRRAWLAVEEGDSHGALTHFRRLIELEPADGIAQWLYAMQAGNDRRSELIRQDLERVHKRLHSGEGPLDFMAAAWSVLGEKDRAERYMSEGKARDCGRAPTPANQDNCEAWYQALIGKDLDDARQRIERVITSQPDKAEFLDTLAVVLEAQGEYGAARDAAVRAASHAPTDTYLLVQAARLQAKVRDTENSE